MKSMMSTAAIGIALFAASPALGQVQTNNSRNSFNTGTNNNNHSGNIGTGISSEQLARIEYVQFGGPTYGSPCTSSPCEIYSGSPAVLEVDRISTGQYKVVFANNTFSEPPTCTVIGGGTEPQESFARYAPPSPTPLTVFNIEFVTTNGGIADNYVQVTCMGPYKS